MESKQFCSEFNFASPLSLCVEFFIEGHQLSKTNLLLGANGFKLKIYNAAKEPKLEAQILAWIKAYLAGKQPKSKLSIAADSFLPLQKKIMEKLQEVPFGATISYKNLAALGGSPKAARAVGRICGLNPYPLFVPCHRVIKQDGSLGGFSGGLEIKKRLLTFEKDFASS